jgi:carboxylesterase
MSAPIIPGAEPFSASGGDQGALVLHGFTGNPFSIRGVASAVAAAGLTVEAPLLPGHGTSVADMVETRWSDWSAAAESAYLDLAARCEKVAVLGLSMGGTLACWLGERYLEVAGLVLINPLVRSIPGDQVAAVRALVDAGETVMDGIGSDIAQPDAAELSYDQTPIEPLLSLLDAADDVGARLADIACSVLLLSSRDDHVVPPANGDDIASALGDRCERVWLERSFHVATLDYDGDEIEKRAADFVSRVTGIDG